MGLLDHYRQFEALTEEEVNLSKRAANEERKRQALARVEPLDLSQTTAPGLPHAYVVNAVTYMARRGLHRYPRQGVEELRSELAHRHDVPPTRVAIGDGASQLLIAAAHALLEPGQELITPWPSYPLFPIMAHRARAGAVPVPGSGAQSILAAVNDRTRVVAVASPNDPTGALWSVSELRGLLGELPGQAVTLLDEALVDYCDAQEPDASLALLEENPRLLVFRTFSKAWGLAGLRVGYALGGPGSEELLRELEPDLGINELAQAGALESLRSGSATLERRTRSIAAERTALTQALRDRGLDVPDSQANFLWVSHPTLDGTRLTDALGRSGITVASGAALGEPERIRVTVRDAAASQRLLAALDALDGAGA